MGRNLNPRFIIPLSLLVWSSRTRCGSHRGGLRDPLGVVATLPGLGRHLVQTICDALREAGEKKRGRCNRPKLLGRWRITTPWNFEWRAVSGLSIINNDRSWAVHRRPAIRLLEFGGFWRLGGAPKLFGSNQRTAKKSPARSN